MVENLLSVQKTQVQSLGQENPLKKGMPTNSSILAWRIPLTAYIISDITEWYYILYSLKNYYFLKILNEA